MTPRGGRLFLATVTSVVLIAFFSAPFILSHGEVNGLSGTPLIMDFAHIWSGMDPISAFAYGFGDILCHQEAERSFELNGSQMPVCVRDLFIILGFLAGLTFFLLSRYRVSVRGVAVFVLVATVLLFTDHTLQAVLSLNIPLTRAVTGFVFGVAISSIVECWFSYFEVADRL